MTFQKLNIPNGQSEKAGLVLYQSKSNNFWSNLGFTFRLLLLEEKALISNFSFLPEKPQSWKAY